MPRLSHTQALLGPEVFGKIKDTRILVVGAGGIGCEVLKNLVLVGFAKIEIIDLDTIDLSNLNRQFLFRKPDISKSKALVAAVSARHFNPSSGIEIHARHGNVKEGVNDVEWLKGFGLVMNALDNMDARKHMNRLCQAAGVPLIESGTAGYMGQVMPIVKDKTECFDCVTKPVPKSFPVCTIRATPSEPIHCIVWAKSYLFGKLFGEDDEAGDTEELDKAQQSGENADEIANLKKEAAAFREVRAKLGEEEGPTRVFKKVFGDDINRLLAMEDMWTHPGRVKPVALEYEDIMEDRFTTPPLRTAAPPIANGVASSSKLPATNRAASSNGAVNGNSRLLKDQRELSVKENLELFVDSCRRLSARSVARPDILLAFDKDDDDTLDFVLATANLRAIAYGIANKTRFQVKEMAGNIIPAIATTNAIIAGLIVMQAINLLSNNLSAAKITFLKTTPAIPIGRVDPVAPSSSCAVCRDLYIPLKVDLQRLTLGEFVKDIVIGWLGRGRKGENGEAVDEDEEFDIQVYEGGRLLADPDFDDNYGRTLEDLGVERGKMLTVRDEDGKYRAIQFCITQPEPNAEKAYTLPPTPPTIPLVPPKPRDPTPSPEPEILDGAPPDDLPSTKSNKRSAPDDGDAALGDEAQKRRKVEDDDDDIIIID